jgi:hypothetical protein
MNIFVLDTDPIVAAGYLCDRHVPKMLLESAQMLSTVLHEAGASHPALYRSTHARHPCTIWTGSSRANAKWLISHAKAIGHEWRVRYVHSRSHASEPILDVAMTMLDYLPDGPITPFALAMPECYRDNDAVLAYRQYYREEKRSIAKWRLIAPEWF